MVNGEVKDRALDSSVIDVASKSCSPVNGPRHVDSKHLPEQ